MRTDIFKVIDYINVNLNVKLSHIKSTCVHLDFLNHFIYSGYMWYFALKQNEINHIQRYRFLRWV